MFPGETIHYSCEEQALTKHPVVQGKRFLKEHIMLALYDFLMASAIRQNREKQ